MVIEIPENQFKGVFMQFTANTEVRSSMGISSTQIASVVQLVDMVVIKSLR